MGVSDEEDTSTMAKKQIIIAVEVRIDVPIYWRTLDENLEASKRAIREAEDMCKEIKRHVNGGERPYVHREIRDICTFCRREWEEEDDGCPLCCDMAVEEWKKVHERSKD